MGDQLLYLLDDAMAEDPASFPALSYEDSSRAEMIQRHPYLFVIGNVLCTASGYRLLLIAAAACRLKFFCREYCRRADLGAAAYHAGISLAVRLSRHGCTHLYQQSQARGLALSLPIVPVGVRWWLKRRGKSGGPATRWYPI